MKTTRLALALAAALALQALPIHAQSSAVPGTISYQGRVTNDDGTLVGATSPTERTVIFRIWDNATATGQANLLYSEKQTVTISKGEFSVLVGNGDPVTGSPRSFDEAPKKLASLADPSLWTGSSRFLGVTVCDEGTDTGPEVAPRQQIASTVYAIKAREAETVTGTNNGAVSLGTTSNGTITEHLRIIGNGDVGIGTSSPDSQLHVAGGANSAIKNEASSGSSWFVGSNVESMVLHNLSNSPMVFTTNATERMRISASGDVGIGTANRTIDGKLHIYGDNPVLNLQNSLSALGAGSALRFGHDQAGSQLPVAEIKSSVTNGNGTGARAGDLVFSTTSGGNLSAKMKLTDTGDLILEKKIPYPFGKYQRRRHL
jgi:hypothetical protein